VLYDVAETNREQEYQTADYRRGAEIWCLSWGAELDDKSEKLSFTIGWP